MVTTGEDPNPGNKTNFQALNFSIGNEKNHLSLPPDTFVRIQEFLSSGYMLVLGARERCLFHLLNGKDMLNIHTTSKISLTAFLFVTLRLRPRNF